MQQEKIIIAGGGLAGLTLAEAFAEKNIPFTLIEPDQKNTNDRTWCFWTREPEKYKNVLTHSWKKLLVASNHFGEKVIKLKDYTYCLVRSKQWYKEKLETVAKFPGATILYDFVEHCNPHTGEVKTKTSTLHADKIFSSIPQKLTKKPQFAYLTQSFLGWWIETKEAVFNPDIAYFMDLRTEQEIGTEFVYVLPLSPTKALFEHTVFAPTIPTKDYFAEKLKLYISTQHNISDYTVIETEYGELPMTNDSMHPIVNDRLIKIGTPAAYLKPTSSYGFTRTEKKITQLVNHLLADKPLTDSVTSSSWRYRYFDGKVLQKLQKDPRFGETFFSALYQRVPFELLLKFLDEEVSLLEQGKVFGGMKSLGFELFS